MFAQKLGKTAQQSLAFAANDRSMHPTDVG